MKTGLPHIDNFSMIKRKNHVKKGRISNVKAIFIENTAGKGRTGNAYMLLPTKNKSKYVPNKDATNKAGIYKLALRKNRRFGDCCKLELFKCLTVPPHYLSIDRYFFF